MPPDYQQEIETFRQHRQLEIAGDDGWITLAGFFWLKDGDNGAGSDPSSEIALPPSAPAHAGKIVASNGTAKFIPAPKVHASELLFKVDDDKSFVQLGSVKFFVIRRDEKLAVRVKDNDAPARNKFTGLIWYPVDPAWRIDAKFTPWPEKRSITFVTVLGTKEKDDSPGYVTFKKGTEELKLDAVIDEGKLFFVFRDRTSGKTTYGAARFLYAEPPATGLGKPGTVTLDFNKAVNPPCMFTPYATCPLPPPQNRLAIEITAGEKTYPNGHSGH